MEENNIKIYSTKYNLQISLGKMSPIPDPVGTHPSLAQLVRARLCALRMDPLRYSFGIWWPWSENLKTCHCCGTVYFGYPWKTIFPYRTVAKITAKNYDNCKDTKLRWNLTNLKDSLPTMNLWWIHPSLKEGMYLETWKIETAQSGWLVGHS